MKNPPQTDLTARQTKAKSVNQQKFSPKISITGVSVASDQRVMGDNIPLRTA